MSKIHLSVDRYALIHKAVPAESQNPPQNSVEAVLAKSQKESAPKICGGSYRQITKRIPPPILWRQFLPNHKKNPPPKSVESVPAESQKEFTPKICGGSSRQISKSWCRQTGGYLKFGGNWLHIIFCRILFEGADADRWRLTKIWNFPPDSFWGG